MTRRFPSLVIAMILLALPLAAQVQDTVPPRFFIERIEVRNAKRVSTDVLIYESRLREGQEYTEADLSDASARLDRLPFLLSSEFALERGSERGRYVLVIRVNETKPFFYRLDIRPILTDNTISGLDQSGDNISASDTEAFIGYRWFVGRRGAVHVGLQFQDDNRDFTQEYGAWALGYTHYDIFGTRAFATVNLKRTHGSGTITPQIVVGMPLSTNQTLTLAYDDVQIDEEDRELAGVVLTDDESQRVGSITWSYNTTNQPYLPTRGTRLSVTPLVAWRDDAFYSFVVTDPPTSPPTVIPVIVHRRSYGVDAAAARFWEITDRSSVSAGAEGGWAKTVDRGRLDRSFDSTYAIVHAGYSWSLWDRDARRDGDNRFEANVRVSTRTREELEREGFLLSDENTLVGLSGSWVRRSSWGIVRLGLGWAW
ncbi:MAG TPA: hypothetical protein VEK11_17205 [Thermoanaerobaculia bacterium]|nr:hypothetical protein [Thermoanaerobaculia bacterium]